jgi:hypothetical protein
VSLHPWAELCCSGSPLLQLREIFFGKGSWLAARQDRTELAVEVAGRPVAQDGHMREAVEVEAEGRELAVGGSEEEVLSLPIRTGRRFLAAETGRPQVGGMLVARCW